MFIYPLYDLFCDYIDNRKQRVVLNGKCSSWQTINAGVPQGSVLGPLMFLIYINDIGNNLSSTATLFADDTPLSKHIIDDNISNNEVQHDLDTNEAWASKWQVIFNPLESESRLVSNFSRQASLARQAFLITPLHGARYETGKNAYAKK